MVTTMNIIIIVIIMCCISISISVSISLIIIIIIIFIIINSSSSMCLMCRLLCSTTIISSSIMIGCASSSFFRRRGRGLLSGRHTTFIDQYINYALLMCRYLKYLRCKLKLLELLFMSTDHTIKQLTNHGMSTTNRPAIV